MYIGHSVIEGLKILGFDKDTIKTVSKEKSLEEIFLSTLFLNYFIVMIVYFTALINGGISIGAREVNMPVFFGLLLIYPFAFNLIVYVTYGFFGLMAEMIDSKKHIRPLVSVGFHTAIVYTILLFVIAFFASFEYLLGLFLLSVFAVYFLYTMFVAISTVYNFTFSHTLIVLFVPFLLLGVVIIILMTLFPTEMKTLLSRLFI